MSLVSGLVPCSSADKRKKKYLVVCCLGVPVEGRRVRVIYVPLKNDSSNITRELPATEGFVPFSTLIVATNDVGEPALYVCGGLDIPFSRLKDFHLHDRFVSKKVHSYDLRKLAKEKESTLHCEQMQVGMAQPLLAHVGDSLFVLGYTESKGLKPAFQVYDFKTTQWTVLSDNLFDIKKCDSDEWTRDNLGFIPHVVIGRKLHVSVGNSSFTFDTKKRVWKDSKLFESFWTSKNTKKRRLSPSNFNGNRVWKGAVENRKKSNTAIGFSGSRRILNGVVKLNRKKYGGPPFGFSGRGILWDKNILLGVHYASKCLVVAFLLDDKGRVVRSQPIIDVDTDSNDLSGGANLVDLGRDGYFGLVHTRFDPDDMAMGSSAMEVVIFVVTKLGASTGDNFLKCEVKRQEFVVKGLGDVGRSFTASCV